MSSQALFEALPVEEGSDPAAEELSPVCDQQKPFAALPRVGSKQALVIDMLSQDTGATLDALVAATGWLPHMTRAALTGLRKRGFVIERERDEVRGTFYRIARNPAIAKS